MILVWIAAGLLAFYLILPRYGLISSYRSWRKVRERGRVEDALKHMLDNEHEGRHASVESLAGVLNITIPAAMRLLGNMEAQNLVEMQGHELHLTAQGESWALQVVRAHRLWERYLADEARMPLEKVHSEAHRRQHRSSEKDLDALEASLGHPRYDPHGDPIPSRLMPSLPKTGTELTNWQTGLPGVIIHLEDEPELAYAQILAAGLRLGQVIRIIEHAPNRLVISDGENEYHLAPAVAVNIHLAPLPKPEKPAEGVIQLHNLSDLQPAKIVGIDESLQGLTRRRFLDLGLTPGAVIYPELKNLFGDPRAYRIRSTVIALRDDQAEKIWVLPIEEETNSSPE